ncbi:hypothetical protein G6O67_006219 [Ophiocordyceps sinensis]|uniref:Uncharacterized protein n=2 Tax=Ophiocordyceps sinensis TaxID=72228 RepID=A0A8H4LV25_9HYPO|nr:hypothetical protein OCS_06207 [Ophiocordyceps sinensis CO18]KAF4506100.1 hypothetical protein G6O67_006219 [Ophiocordyceps sinensis]
MEQMEKRLGIICPGTTTFHVCTDKPSRFVGCCAVDPCGTRDGNCPQASLDATSFHKLSYPDVPGQACVNKKAGGGLWYACADLLPPFLGCCAIDPCRTGGCPSSSLRAAALSDNKTAAAIFLGEKIPASSSSARSSATSSATGAARGDADGPGLSNGAVAGISVGASVVAILLMAGLVFWLRKRFEVKRKQQQQWRESSAGADAPQHNSSPNMQSVVSPCTSPGTLVNSPYTGFQPSPPQQWNSHQHHGAHDYTGAGAMTAELPGAASDGTRKAYHDKIGAAKMDHGPAELGGQRPARQFAPVELEDPATYDRGGGRPA